MGDLDHIVMRKARPADDNFIYSTWLRGLYYGNDWYQSIPKDIYFKNYCQVIKLILSRPSVHTQAACLRDDLDVILAYAVFEKAQDHRILHWIYTKAPWRHLGIAKQLMGPDRSQVKEVSHLTKVGRGMKPKEWVFNPFLV